MPAASQVAVVQTPVVVVLRLAVAVPIAAASHPADALAELS